MTPCGFDLKNIVYVKYVSAVTGKAISDSIITNHRNAFHELLTMHGIYNIPKKRKPRKPHAVSDRSES